MTYKRDEQLIWIFTNDCIFYQWANSFTPRLCGKANQFFSLAVFIKEAFIYQDKKPNLLCATQGLNERYNLAANRKLNTIISKRALKPNEFVC